MRFGLLALSVAAFAVGVSCPAHAATVRLLASSPWLAYADPLAPETGVPVIPAVFDSLTGLSNSGQVTPALAISWENDQNEIWRFRVRPDVVFSDGSPADATAVAECLNILIGPDRETYGNSTYTQDIVSVRAVAPDVVEISTKGAIARLDRMLANVRIFSASAYRKMGRSVFAKSPVGTGPYRPVAWPASGNAVVLEAVPTSWRAPIDVDRVEIRVVTDSTSRIQSLLTGKTDIAHSIDPDAITSLEDADFKISILPSPMVMALALRTAGDAAAPLRDRKVRLAMNMAVNRAAISEHLLKGTMPPATQFATADVLGYDPSIEPYPYDPDSAKKLLAEAGYGNGFELIGMVSTGQIPGDQLIYQQVVQDLKSVGIDVQLNVLPINEFLRRRSATSWDGIDIYGTLLAHFRYGDISRAAELNSCIDPISTFCAPDMVDLIETSNREMRLDVRERLLKTINARFQELAPVIQIVNFSSIVAYSKRLANLPHSTGVINFEAIDVVSVQD